MSVELLRLLLPQQCKLHLQTVLYMLPLLLFLPLLLRPSRCHCSSSSNR